MVRSNYLSLVLFTINAAVNSETGFRPLDAKFGSDDGPRDLALHQRNSEVPLPTKLSSPYSGPYEVIQQVKNDVEYRHLVMRNIKVLNFTCLKLFVGDREEA